MQFLLVVFLKCLYIVDDVVGIPGVVKIHAHQLDALLMYSVSMIFCRHSIFSCSHVLVFVVSPKFLTCQACEGVGDVVGVEAPHGGVAQVIFHGIQVVEVGLQVREHQDRGEEEDGEGQVEVEREVEENQRQQHMCDMRMT